MKISNLTFLLPIQNDAYVVMNALGVALALVGIIIILIYFLGGTDGRDS